MGHDFPPFKVQGSIRHGRDVPADSGTPPLPGTPHIPHCRGLYSEDLDGVGDAIKIFLFLDLSPSARSKVTLLSRRWDIILGEGGLTSFANMILLIAKQKFERVTRWEDAENQIEAWGVFYKVLLEDAALQPTTYEVCTLVEDTAHVGAILREPMQRQPALTIAFLCILQTEFNKIFRKALERQQGVRWPYFERLRQYLATGNFRPDSIALPGAFTPQVPGVQASPSGAHPANPTPAPPTDP